MTRLRRLAHAGILLVPIALASCDGQPSMLTGGAITKPSNVPAQPATNVFNVFPAVMPPTIPFQILPVFGCPLVSPFATSFSLVIDQRDGLDIIVSEVGLRFIDQSGFESPLIFSESDLATLFGTTIVLGGTRRMFPFHPRFGCGLRSTPHVMVVRLLLRDRSGRSHERTLTARAEGPNSNR